MPKTDPLLKIDGRPTSSGYVGGVQYAPQSGSALSGGVKSAAVDDGTAYPGSDGRLPIVGGNGIDVKTPDTITVVVSVDETVPRSSLSGQITVAPGSTITLEMNAASTQMYTVDNKFSSGDLALFDAHGRTEQVLVTANGTLEGSYYCYPINRGVNGTTAGAWYKGDIVLNLGPAGSHILALHAEQRKTGGSLLGPSVTITEYLGSNSWDPVAVFGSLKSMYGLPASSLWGVAAGRYATGKSWFTVDSESGLRIGNGTTLRALYDVSGIKLYDGPGTERVHLDSSGSGWLAGSNKLAWDSSGNLTLAGTVKSDTYTAGLTGWQINRDGNAEFNNVTVRGAIKSAVFEKSLITAFAGSQIVAKSASASHTDTTVTGTTFTLNVKKQAGAAPFANGDIVRIKDGITDTWATVDTGTDQTTHWSYTATRQAGSTTGTVVAGTTIVDYGQSGQGYWIVSADGLLGPSAAWALRSHAGAPWSAETTHVYAGTDGKLYAGSGSVSLDSNGIVIADTQGYPGKLSWSMPSAAFVSEVSSYRYQIGTGGGVTLSGDPYALHTEIFALSPNDHQTEIFLRAAYGGDRYGYTHSAGLTIQAKQGSVDNGVTIPGLDQVYAFPLLRVGGDLKVDGLATIGTLTQSGSAKLTVNGGVAIQSSGSDVVTFGTNGNVYYTGNLVPVRGGTTYTGYTFVPLTTPLTSASWNSSLRSTTSATVIDLSAVFGVPANVKAVLVRAESKETANTPSTGTYFSVGPSAAYYYAVVAHAVGSTLKASITGICPCDANGDIYYRVVASGTNTLTAHLEIWGYFI